MFATVHDLASAQRQRILVIGIVGLALAGAVVVYANKASRNASAIVRWRDLIESVARGENVYNEWTKDGSFPYPPIAGIVLWPLTKLPPVAAALTWFALKLAMAAAAVRWSISIATKPTNRFSLWHVAVLLTLASRPLLGDLQHGNINILILFLTTAGLMAYRHGRDSLAGVAIALAGAIKVTPLLFVPYFLWKRQWRVVAWAGGAVVLFGLVIPGLFVGFERNAWLIRSWSGAMIEPYVVDGRVETIQTNQSLAAILLRMFTDCPGIELDDGTQFSVNCLNLPHASVLWIAKALSLMMLGWIAWFSRERDDDRDNPRLALEYSLVFIAMLLISERSWKHHFVTMTLPYAVLIASAARSECSALFRRLVWLVLGAAFLLMASTSTELGGWLANGAGHKYAQAYGLFGATALLALIAISFIRFSGPYISPMPSPIGAAPVSPRPAKMRGEGSMPVPWEQSAFSSQADDVFDRASSLNIVDTKSFVGDE